MRFHKVNSKQQALDLFEAKRREFLDYARWVARKICSEKGHVTIDDIREVVQLPQGIDGRVYGAVFRGDGWIKTGYTQTTVKSSHRRPIAIFTVNPLNLI